jgi:hypothetical protein
MLSALVSTPSSVVGAALLQVRSYLPKSTYRYCEHRAGAPEYFLSMPSSVILEVSNWSTHDDPISTKP